uniref:Uncharacterized protein n=1 Tax=Ralstonia solanacearum TaxID=305 RepID=A0A0S4XCL0_RALSL|nr:protein of unknown function [Ralstonia solanacearum]
MTCTLARLRKPTSPLCQASSRSMACASSKRRWNFSGVAMTWPPEGTMMRPGKSLSGFPVGVSRLVTMMRERLFRDFLLKRLRLVTQNWVRSLFFARRGGKCGGGQP